MVHRRGLQGHGGAWGFGGIDAMVHRQGLQGQAKEAHPQSEEPVTVGYPVTVGAFFGRAKVRNCNPCNRILLLGQQERGGREAQREQAKLGQG